MDIEDNITIEHSFDNSLDEVWKAITDLNQMKLWFFEQIEDFVPTIGFETQFEVHIEERTFTHLWKIIEVIPLNKIVYNWKYEEYSGDSNVTFELIKSGNQTKLILTHKVTDTFPSNIPEFELKSGIDGWNYFIKDRLYNYLKS